MNSPVAKNIKNLREARAWTQEQLAAAASITPRTVQRAESGHPLAAESLQAIAGALDAELEELRRDHDAEAAAAYLERFIRVELRSVEEGAALLRPLSAAQAFMVRPSSDALADGHVRELAEVETILTDLVDLVNDLPPTAMLEMLKDLDPVLERLRVAGRFIAVGTYEAPFGPVDLDTMLLFVSEKRADVALVEKPPSPKKVAGPESSP